MSDANFTITGPVITATSPNGGENWTAGSTQTIRWTYTGNPGSYVRIELLRGGVLNRTLSTSRSIGTNGSGSYNWTIPSNQAPDVSYAIRITSRSNTAITDTSDALFTIIGPPPPSITVITPNGGETWTKSSRQMIRWTYTGTAGNYAKIELLKNGTVNRIISTSARMGTGGAGSYYWNIPYNQTSGDDYQIRITSTSNSSVSDMGNGVFTIP
jgi:hypothetical protein